MPHDLLIRNASVVRDQVTPADVAIADGKIVAIGTDLGGAAEEIDADGLHLLPGAIDPHVHFNDPGRAEWEGWATGSNAAAAGGTTCVFDMPLNSSPPTLDGESFDLKVAAAAGRSRVDFALWGGLTPNNLDAMEELAGRGVIGFKAFMSGSGVGDFERANDAILLEGMRRASELDSLVGVHAENEEITATIAADRRGRGETTVYDYLDSRPIIAEVDAVRRVLLFAQVNRCRVHLVHLSTAWSVWAVHTARSAGAIDATCETCPHYLLLAAEDVGRLGVAAKCAPPLRQARQLDKLWDRVRTGHVDLIATDHSPAPPSMKRFAPADPEQNDFFAAWGGIAGVQSLLGTLLGEGHLRRGLPLPDVARLTSTAAAERFRIKGKGRIVVGYDADLVLVDLSAGRPLERADLLDRHKLSPFVGLPIGGFVQRTILRGQTIFRDGQLVGDPAGRLVRPGAS